MPKRCRKSPPKGATNPSGNRSQWRSLVPSPPDWSKRAPEDLPGWILGAFGQKMREVHPKIVQSIYIHSYINKTNGRRSALYFLLFGWDPDPGVGQDPGQDRSGTRTWMRAGIRDPGSGNREWLRSQDTDPGPREPDRIEAD